MHTIESLRHRTDAKLRYAQIHLAELRSLEKHDGSDFDRAHQESFLFHLIGTRDAFLQELNTSYSIGVEGSSDMGKLRKKSQNAGILCPELDEIDALENDPASWLFIARAMRNTSTHDEGPKRKHHIGGANHGKIVLTERTKNTSTQGHFTDTFELWTSNMRDLVSRLRASTLASTS